MRSSLCLLKRHNGRYGISENLKYEYDKNGNIVKISENGLLTVRYAYGSVSRLIREDNRALGKTWLYSYDNKGNILSKRETAFTLKAAVEESEFTSVQYGYNGDALLFVGTEACTYDALGNPSVYRGKAVSWSNGRRMVSYGGTALTYDGLGRRLSKGNITYTYDGSNRVIGQSDGQKHVLCADGLTAVAEATKEHEKGCLGDRAAFLRPFPFCIAPPLNAEGRGIGGSKMKKFRKSTLFRKRKKTTKKDSVRLSYRLHYTSFYQKMSIPSFRKSVHSWKAVFDKIGGGICKRQNGLRLPHWRCC